MARALITGIGGQDGSYLAEQLLDRGYEVAGTVLGSPADYPWLEGVRDRIRFVELDLTDADAAGQAASELELDELYHLAAVSFVPAWWEDPVGLTRTETAAVAALLEGLRRARPETRAFLASSSEIFAGTDTEPQSETTLPAPLTPYGAAKAYGLYVVQSFRRRYGLHASSGILFNHESPRRPEHFVTRKITRAAAAISLGLEDHVALGNLDARRDWGFAGDYTRAMQLMARAEQPDDYVVATGEAHTVRELAAAAFSVVGLDWQEYVRARRVARPRRDRRARARRRPDEGPRAAGMEARGRLRRTGADDGSGRPNNLHVRFRARHEASSHHRNHRPGRLVPGRAAAREGLRGVAAWCRRSSTESSERIEHLVGRVHLVQGDLLDQASLVSVLEETQPDEVYNLAAQSFVPTSWNQPVLTAEFTAVGVTRMLEAIRRVDPSIRFYQASSSEMFGKVREVPQTEVTPFYPRSPYGVAKVYGHFITVNYRESYDLFAVSGILFNHESPRRGLEFVTRKITRRRRAHQAGPGRRAACSATSTPSATGASPATTCARCG